MDVLGREIGLSEEEKSLIANLHNFASTVMRPIGIELDKLNDPADVIKPESSLWKVFDKSRELGIDFFSLASAEMPLERQALLRSIVAEEMGWGDAGLAISLGVSIFPRMLALLSGNPDLMERFGKDDVIGCWPITEPDHGSDIIQFGGDFEHFPGRPNCLATRSGDLYIINGQKSAWVSNGTIADAAALFCALDDGDGIIGLGGFLVPLEAKGISRGKPLDKIGQRSLNQGEIFFDNVEVPKENLIIKPGSESLGTDAGLALANSSMGSTFVGVAQGAFDLALAYSKERIQGGVPIFKHQNVKGKLFGMYRKVEAARALSRRAVLVNTLSAPNLALSVASKVNATQSAFEVASDAIQIFGGNGLSREYPIEKFMRDARASMIEDGCNDVLSLIAAEKFIEN